MNSYLLKLKECFEYMYDRVGYKKWFSNLGTSLEYYIRKFKNNEAEFLKKKIIDLNLESDKNFLKKIWLPKKPKSTAPFRQFMSLLVSLDIFKNIGESKWEINNYNIRINKNSLINQWSKFNYSYIKNEGLASSLRIIYGFMIYLSYRVIGKNDFILLCENLNNEISEKLKKTYFIKSDKMNHLSFETTYADLYDKYFNDVDRNELLKVFRVIKEHVTYYSDDEFDKEISTILDNVEEKEKLIDKKNRLIDEIYNDEKFYFKKQSINSKINKIVRYKFSSFLKSQENHFYINDKLFDNKNLTESAHIISVEDIVDKIIQKKKNNEDIMELLKNFTLENNGVQIPFNYHKLYDDDYIGFSIDYKKFIPTKKGEENIRYVIDCGFNINNYFSEEKVNDIEQIVKLFKNI